MLKGIFVIITTFMILLNIMSCGGENNDGRKKIHIIEIQYEISDIGINLLIIPFEIKTDKINGSVVSRIRYAEGTEGIIYSFLYSDEQIIVDKQACPVINGYKFNGKCVYIIR